ncbi:MAG: DivIVA domain-containing protein [Actinomycetota bacterium]
MDLGPRDIHEKQFHDAWRGYSQEEVDDFLDRVADVLEQTQRANESLTQRVSQLEGQLAQAREGEQMLKKTLVTAQQHAEEAMATARAHADKIVAEATERGRSVTEEARTKASSIESDARKRTQEAERASEQRKRELETSLEKLRTLETETKQKLKSFLDAQQRSLSSLSERRPPTGGAARPQPAPAQRQTREARPGEAAGGAPPWEQPSERPGPQPKASELPDYDPEASGDPGARRTLRSLFGRDEE